MTYACLQPCELQPRFLDHISLDLNIHCYCGMHFPLPPPLQNRIEAFHKIGCNIAEFVSILVN